MVGDGDHLPHALHLRHVEPGRDNADAVGGLGDDEPPGVGDQRMAVSRARLVVDGESPGLRAGAHVGFGFDGAGAQQDFPVVLAGLLGEGGGQRDHLRALLRQRLEQAGKAQVVADRAADGDALAVVGDDEVAGLDGRALLIRGAVGSGDVEQMDFSIARDFLAFAVEYDCRVVDAFVACDFFHDRAGVDEHAMFLRHLLRHFIGGAVGKDFGVLRLVALLAARPVELFGEQDPIGPFLADGALDERLRRRDIGGLVVDRVHLNERDFHIFTRRKVGRQNIGGAGRGVKGAVAGRGEAGCLPESAPAAKGRLSFGGPLVLYTRRNNNFSGGPSPMYAFADLFSVKGRTALVTGGATRARARRDGGVAQRGRAGADRLAQGGGLRGRGAGAL